MRVYLGKFVPLSPTHYTGHMAAVVYFCGCNWRCPYCNVPELLDAAKCKDWLASDIFTEIVHSREFIDSVVFTGGEPTLQSKALIVLCKLARRDGLAVKVHTNGSRPWVIKELLTRDLVDTVAVDVKDTFENYSAITGVEKPEVEKVMETLEILEDYGKDFEIVIPVIKGVNDKRVPKIVDKVPKGRVVLQEFEEGNLVDPNFKGRSPTRMDLVDLARECRKPVRIRTKIYGEELV